MFVAPGARLAGDLFPTDYQAAKKWRDDVIPSGARNLLFISPLIGKWKEKAEDRGVGYQTMLKIILHEHVDDY